MKRCIEAMKWSHLYDVARDLFFVEGPSDKFGLEKLFENEIMNAQNNGVAVKIISFDGKEPLLNKGYIKALKIIRNKPDSFVFIVPDLYPPNKPFEHGTYEELKSAVISRFKFELEKAGSADNLIERFSVHCFKFDFESLILASEEPLKVRLGIDEFKIKWKKPVEIQNHNKPPKKIVDDLFKSVGKRYKDTIDAPWILEKVEYNQLCEKCSQNFKPFVEDLLRLIRSG